MAWYLVVPLIKTSYPDQVQLMPSLNFITLRVTMTTVFMRRHYNQSKYALENSSFAMQSRIIGTSSITFVSQITSVNVPFTVSDDLT